MQTDKQTSEFFSYDPPFSRGNKIILQNEEKLVYYFFVSYGWYNSALFKTPLLLPPPVTNTFPFVNTDAACWYRM